MICINRLGLAFCAMLVLMSSMGNAQEVPSLGENLGYLTTFGKRAPEYWGDDDHTQIFFFLVPTTFEQPFYIRVFDPDCGGEFDLANSAFNTKTKFTLYGGAGTHSEADARWIDPKGKYKSGTVLASETFDSDDAYDNGWYTFGPLNPKEGEFSSEFGGYVFKMIAEGLSGDDGNLYRYALSTDRYRNRPVEGGNAFTYEYSFRLLEKPVSIAHLYPFVDSKVVSITQNNFDFDNDGTMRIYSISKNGHSLKVSGDNNWAESVHQITDEERGKSLDVQILKKSDSSNDMVIYITNQYDEPLPFFAIPIGGPPKYKYNFKVTFYPKEE